MTSAGSHGYAVADFVEDLKAMLEALGPSEATLEQAGRLMRHLAERDDLYPETGYAELGDDAPCVTLHTEPGGALTLWLLRVPVAETPRIHSHGAWGVACGYKGVALNVRWARQDDGTRAGYAEVAETGHKRLERGDAAWWPGPPDDLHSIEGRDGRAAWVLALLGAGSTDGMLMFDAEQRRVWRETSGPGCLPGSG